MVKKLLSLGFVLLGVLMGTAQAQVSEKSFPNTACKSVDVVYLSEKSSGNLRLFRVEKFSDNLTWRLHTTSQDILKRLKDKKQMEFVTIEKGIDPLNEEVVFNSNHVILRFDFGMGDDGFHVYKKYCVDFQEAIPIGQKSGELAKSVGGDTGIDLVKSYVAMVYRVGVTLLSLICVLVIVVSGIQISSAGVDSGAVEQAKGRIAQALLSLALLFGSAMILKAINPGFFL
ncbi:hypothetical protein CSB37_01850 [bacterium DOLZORAL124_38_8]|nr:MAG: hypothetical protein CSB37_01850 [bacterium DOLZORAL124_38_8]